MEIKIKDILTKLNKVSLKGGGLLNFKPFANLVKDKTVELDGEGGYEPTTELFTIFGLDKVYDVTPLADLYGYEIDINELPKYGLDKDGYITDLVINEWNKDDTDLGKHTSFLGVLTFDTYKIFAPVWLFSFNNTYYLIADNINATSAGIFGSNNIIYTKNDDE